MAVGGGTEAGAVRQERPRRLQCHTASRLSAAWISLDGRHARTLVVRTLLADAVLQVPASAEGAAEGEAEGRARSRFSRVAATAAADDDLPGVPDTSCTDSGTDTDTANSNPTPVRVVHVGVVAPAAVTVLVTVLVVVVHAVATIAFAADEEQRPAVFHVRFRCVTPFHSLLPPALTCFFLLVNLLFFVARFLLFSTRLSFMMYHTFFFFTPSRPIVSHSHLIAAFISGLYPCPCTTTATASSMHQLTLLPYCLEGHGQTCCPQCPRKPLHIQYP